MISGNNELWQKEGGRWDFWFCSFGYFLGQFMCKKTLVFRFWCSLRFTDLLVFGFHEKY